MSGLNQSTMERVFDTMARGAADGINPSVTDSSTFVFETPDQMRRTIDGEDEGLYVYSRLPNPTTHRLADALSALEGTPAAVVTGSGMAAISSLLLSLCAQGDEIVAARTIYGGTYALLARFLPRFGVRTTFVDLDDREAVEAALSPRTRVLFCETLSNPLLQVADIAALSSIARQHDVELVVDNTFAPLLVEPWKLGATAVVVSLTKYVNGMADGLGGAVCAGEKIIERILDHEEGTALVLGGVLDPYRAASMYKNLRSLHLRMRQHSENALVAASALDDLGLRVHYPGLPGHIHHERFRRMASTPLGFGGILSVDLGDAVAAEKFVTEIREAGRALVAVSLGCPFTVVTVPSTSTAGEIPDEDQRAMGLGPGLVRVAVGFEPDPAPLAHAMVTAARAVARAGA